MLRQILKYDFKAIAKKLVPIYLLFLFMTTITANLLKESFYDYFTLLSFNSVTIIFVIINFMLWLYVIFYTEYLIITRYSKTIFGKEGYLTHTLPLSSHKILVIKTFQGFFWLTLSFIVTFITSFLIFVATIDFYILKQLINNFFNLIAPVFTVSNSISLLITFIIYSILYTLVMILMFYASIGIGSRFERKLFVSIIAFIAIYFSFSYLNRLIGAYTYSSDYYFGSKEVILKILNSKFELSVIINYMLAELWKSNIFMLLMNACLYYISYYSIKNKNI